MPGAAILLECRSASPSRSGERRSNSAFCTVSAPKSRAPVKDQSPHFPVFADFANASYQQRYEVLCRRLIQEQLYSAASVIATPRTALRDGAYGELSAMTGLRSFVASLAGHIATQAAR
ncbi:MAG: hypothetical protein KA185_17710 [Vitreoscilla sp.]|nr:hypothetical protein [Vitreoscilla sp.]